MSGRIYRFGEYTLNTRTRELRCSDALVALSPRAFGCLVHLIEHRDRAVDKDELVRAIWGRPNVSDTQLGQTILRARRAVGDDGQGQQAIRTVSRYGYRWVFDVDVAELPDATPVPVVEADAPTPTSAPVPPARASRRRGFAYALLASAALLVFAIAGYRIAHTRAQPAFGASAVVLPLQVEADASHAWLRLGGMDLLAERLRAGDLAVPPSESTVALLQGAKSDDDATHALRSVAPTALLVRGRLAQREGRWTCTLSASTVDGAMLDVAATQTDALAAIRDSTDRLLGRLGRAQPPASPLATGTQERLQRAQAAMLANDLDGARAIIIDDPQLARDEPQLGYRLAQVDFRSGDYVRAETALTALLGETVAADPLFRARLLNARGGVRIRQDHYVDAEHDYDDAVALLRDGGHAPELGLALTGRGVVRSMRHDFAAALADLGEARVQLEAAGDALAVARVDSNLGSLEMTRDRPEQALGYLDNAATQFERYGAINELMETLTSLVSDNLALLRPIDALAASDRSWALDERVSDPNQRMELRLDRVDVLLALGRLREAHALLAMLPANAAQMNPFVARRLPALRARLALGEGRPEAARDAAREALALRAPGDDFGEGIAEIALVEQRALRAMSTLAPVPATAVVAAPEYPVQAVLDAEAHDARGEQDAAATSYRAALDLSERRGVPADVALVATSYGPWLLRTGRVREAGEIIGRVSPWAERDFECALLQVRLFHARFEVDAWSKALTQAIALAGERPIPDALREPPRRSTLEAD
jgi:DNA-binding winged helix-turn-helix (wHTH) protein/tetratricopeptide (TPR) repeat protein